MVLVHAHVSCAGGFCGHTRFVDTSVFWNVWAEGVGAFEGKSCREDRWRADDGFVALGGPVDVMHAHVDIPVDDRDIDNCRLVPVGFWIKHIINLIRLQIRGQNGVWFLYLRTQTLEREGRACRQYVDGCRPQRSSHFGHELCTFQLQCTGPTDDTHITIIDQ